jgi:hypothetical protein
VRAIWRSSAWRDKERVMSAIAALPVSQPTMLSAVTYYLDAVETG